MASVEQRGTSFRVSWRLGGKRGGAPQSFTAHTPAGRSVDGARLLAETAKRLAESRGHAITRDEMYRAILGEDRTAPAGVPTLAGWSTEWLTARERLRDVQEDTLATYSQILRDWALPFLGHLALTQIHRETVRDWVAWLRAQTTKPRKNTPARPLSARTVNRVYTVLQQVLGAAVEKGWIPANPAARPAGARKSSTGLPKPGRYPAVFLERWELKAILANCSPDMRDIAFVLSRTGLRIGELLVLRAEDAVLGGKRPRILVRRTRKRGGSVGAPKTEQSVREVTIDADTVAVLRRRAAGKGRADLLFPAPQGGIWSPSSLRRLHWLPAVAAAQRCPEHPPAPPRRRSRKGPAPKWSWRDVSTCSCPRVVNRTPRPHDLRHTHVSILVATGQWGPKEIQERVGHSSFRFTMDVYGHLWNHGDKDRLDAMRREFDVPDDEDEDE